MLAAILMWIGFAMLCLGGIMAIGQFALPPRARQEVSEFGFGVLISSIVVIFVALVVGLFN